MRGHDLPLLTDLNPNSLLAQKTSEALLSLHQQAEVKEGQVVDMTGRSHPLVTNKFSSRLLQSVKDREPSSKKLLKTARELQHQRMQMTRSFAKQSEDPDPRITACWAEGMRLAEEMGQALHHTKILTAFRKIPTDKGAPGGRAGRAPPESRPLLG